MVKSHETIQSGGANHIFYLAKFFDKERYAVDFLNGHLYANRLSYFRCLEEGDTANRGDKHEGTVVWGQPGKISIEINGHDMSNDLAGPVSISSNRLDQFNVLCLYAACIRDSGQEFPRDVLEIKELVRIPEKCQQLGKIAIVIKNGPEFLRRVSASANINGYREAHGLVKYYDPKKFSGQFPGISGAFMKQRKFRYQSEYRVVFETGSLGADALVLNIGDISDIAILTTIPEINRTLEVKCEE